MKTIHRVENEEGFGCYRNKKEDKEIYAVIGSHFKMGGTNKQPLPYNDKGIDRCTRNEICGFLDLKQATNWFTPNELKGLEKLGYTLKKVIVKEITAIGKKQILAIR